MSALIDLVNEHVSDVTTVSSVKKFLKSKQYLLTSREVSKLLLDCGFKRSEEKYSKTFTQVKQVDSELAPVLAKVELTYDKPSVPQKDSSYVKWGFHSDLVSIIESNIFYPVYIEGLSGNGKSLMCQQVAAECGKKFLRVQISPETDESDLIGSFRLVGGDTVFVDGPVISAMREGAVLLIDEIDRSTNKIMCLQGIIEGSPFLIKKTGEVVHPAPGFQIIATANTAGRGDDTGKFAAASIIDEAFLERFIISITQPYPSAAIESKILKKHFVKYTNNEHEALTKVLVQWAQNIRKVYDEEGIDDVISTRRLCHIVKSYAIFKNIKKAVTMCVNRFEEDTKTAMIELFTSLLPDDIMKQNEDSINEFLEKALNN